MPAAFQHYALGVSNTKHPRLLVDGELHALYNGTVKSGYCEPRPPFIEHNLSAIDPASTFIFGKGIAQGMAFYNAEEGPALVIAVDGSLFYLSLETDRLQRIGSKPYFSKHSEKVYLAPRGPYFIAQNGISQPVVIRHKKATQGTPPLGVPCGTLMAEGWGRLAVVAPDRRRMYFSNHNADPTTSLPPGLDIWLAFTEATSYYKNAPYIQVPASAGKIVGLTFLPSLNGDGNLGPLAAICERSTWFYQISVPREQWGTVDISSCPLPFIGTCGPDTVAIRGNDALFRDQSGRLQQMRVALRRNDDARITEYDANVRNIIAADHETQIHRSISVSLRSRHTLIAHNPEIVQRDDGRHAVRHRSILVINEEKLVPTDPLWDGVWNGIFPVAMCVAPYRGIDTIFILSLDSDGTNRLYRLGSAAGPDSTSRGIKHQPMLAITRADVCGATFAPKNFTAGIIRVGEATGPVTVDGAWIRNGALPVPWFTDNHNVPAALTTSGFPCAQDLPPIIPPTPPGGAFHDLALAITIRGQARLEECNIDAAPQGPRTSNNTTSQAVNEHCPVYACPLDAINYDLAANS